MITSQEANQLLRKSLEDRERKRSHSKPFDDEHSPPPSVEGENDKEKKLRLKKERYVRKVTKEMMIPEERNGHAVDEIFCGAFCC